MPCWPLPGSTARAFTHSLWVCAISFGTRAWGIARPRARGRALTRRPGGRVRASPWRCWTRLRPRHLACARSRHQEWRPQQWPEHNSGQSQSSTVARAQQWPEQPTLSSRIRALKRALEPEPHTCYCFEDWHRDCSYCQHDWRTTPLGKWALTFRERHLKSMLLDKWRQASMRSSRNRALVSRCWAWHPDGALMQKLARQFLR